MTTAEPRTASCAQTTEPASTGVALAVPTLNAGRAFDDWLSSLDQQTLRPEHLLMIDSSSDDDTVLKALQAGFEVDVVDRRDFSHGGTRQRMIEQLGSCEIVIFLTQDALLVDSRALERLAAAFKDSAVGAAYGRQLPRPGADPIEEHARLFNYPEHSHQRSREDIPTYGIKSSFLSNSFAGWRVKALEEIGGFPDHTIQNEDAFAASKLILAGWKIAYVAEAEVYHSHRLSIKQEFKRYFDIGVFHSRDPWIRDSFGSAGGEGARFVLSELRHLSKARPSLIPSAIVRTASKYAAFRLGNMESRLPASMRRRLSSNRAFWTRGDKS